MPTVTRFQLPPVWPDDLQPALAAKVAESGSRVVVLDDDPTGTQTVHDVPVYTDWKVETLIAALEQPGHIFYLLTNSRSFPEQRATEIAREVGTNLRLAARAANREFTVISRSDSTLRGHYPAEVDALAHALEREDAPHVLIPAFFEGNRETIGDTHFIHQGNDYIPVHTTPFAQDAVFGYQNSDLKRWIEEKTKGRIPSERVLSIGLEELRVGGPEAVTRSLLASNDAAVIVNAADYRDLEVFTFGLLAAEAAGRRYLYRTAASFVVTRSGMARRGVLRPDEFNLEGVAGGLIMVGSYVPLTTTQLGVLLDRADVDGIELDVGDLLDDSKRNAAVRNAAERGGELLSEGRNVVIYTSREVVTVEGAAGNLEVGTVVSNGLVSTLQAIPIRPRFIIAKGGITSSDLATRGLGVRKAMVRGQILPGVPLWRLGEESRFPGLDYVVFPGNVGAEAALSEAVGKLSRSAPHDPRS